MIAGQVSARTAADRCPFRGPFPAGFEGCPTYQEVSFTAVDSQGQRLGTWLTCRHLASGDYPRQRGQYYPRCTLGSADDRIQWLARVSLARLEVVRALQREYEVASKPYREALLAAKARLLASPDVPGLRGDLERGLESYRDAVRGFLEERKSRFGEVGLPIERVMEMVEVTSRAWAAGEALVAPNPDPTALGGLAPHFQAFIADPLGTPWRMVGQPVAPVYEDSILRISPGVSGLRFMGTIDASNLEAVSQTLQIHVAGSDEYHLDLSGLLFCDVGGLRLIVEAAGRLVGGGKLHLEGIPAHLAKVTELAGWADQPNLVLVPMEMS